MKLTQEDQLLLFDDGTFLSISNCNGWVKIILELCIGLTLPFILVLHPGLKIKYFQQQDWEEEWIDKAKNLVCEEYIICYEGKSGIIILLTLPIR